MESRDEREMVKDPICGMSVEPEAAAESRTRNGGPAG